MKEWRRSGEGKEEVKEWRRSGEGRRKEEARDRYRMRVGGEGSGSGVQCC